MSETIVDNLLIEIDALTFRLRNITEAYINTNHCRLRNRFIHENHNILQRIDEIFLIALLINKRTKEKISFSSLLIEKCKRTLDEIKMKQNLFFL